jgi:TonB family protein
LKRGDVLVLNYFNQEPQEVFVRNPNIGTVILGEESPTIPNQPRIKVEHSPIIVKDKNYTEAKPEFGQEAFNIYLKENLRKPTKAIENRISGRVTVEFKVDTTGEVSDFKILKSLGFGCDEEAIRLIKEGQKWFPALRYGVKEDITWAY